MLEADLDLDSDHTSDFGGPEGVEEEDAIEWSQPGPAPNQAHKYVVVNDYYQVGVDTNGIPGYVDGYDLQDGYPPDDGMERPYGPVDNELFVPMVMSMFEPVGFPINWSGVKVTFTYDGAEPKAGPYAATENLRVWTAAQTFARDKRPITAGGNYVPFGVPIEAGKLGLPGSMTLYLEGLYESATLAGNAIRMTIGGIPGESAAECRFEDTVHCTVIRVDVDVDSDNDNGFEPPARNADEDRYEDMTNQVGKILVVNNGDKDGDGVPDYADGYNLLAGLAEDNVNTNERFAPIVFELAAPIDLDRARVRVTYPGSDPAAVVRVTNGVYRLPAEGSLRIWKRIGGAETRNSAAVPAGDYVAPGEYSARDFGFTGDVRVVTYYLEAVSNSAVKADQRILFEVDPDERAPHPSFIAADAVRVTSIAMALVPDFNHDREIDDQDRLELLRNAPYRFWINNDHDESAAEGSDWPVSRWWNATEDDRVNSVRDLVDFFPLFVDVKGALDVLGTGEYRYFIRYPGAGNGTVAAFKCFYASGLTPDTAGRYLTSQSLAESYDAQRVEPLIDHELTAMVLGEIQGQGKGIFLLEGAAGTTGSLQVEIVKRAGGASVGTVGLRIRTSDVRDMFRYLNLRRVSGQDEGGPDRLQEPPNWPDRLCNGKHLVFTHGYNENANEGLGNICETYKRLYWSGSKAKYTGVNWRGDMGLLHYHWSVTNAFRAAPVFAAHVSQIPDELQLMAYSLGNVMVSSAIHDHNVRPTKYYMVHAAVAREAYDASSYDERMVHEDWRSYTNVLYASRWHALPWRTLPQWGVNDGRMSLTWKGRFAEAVGPETYNFHSTGEDVLRNYDRGRMRWSVVLENLQNMGEYVWCIQELWKGRMDDRLGGSEYGGWGFVDRPTYHHGRRLYRPEEAARIPLEDLKSKPFFNSDDPVPLLCEAPDDPGGPGSRYAQRERARLLAQMIPATSYATGRNPVQEIADQGGLNLDMNSMQNGWPQERLRFRQTRDRWLHGDYRAVAYVYVYKMFDKIAEKGELTR